MKRDFEFDGSGFGYLWLCIWTTVLTVITCGLFFPWAYSAQQRWICSNTYVNGRQLRFEGTGFGFFFQWLLILPKIKPTPLCSSDLPKQQKL